MGLTLGLSYMKMTFGKEMHPLISALDNLVFKTCTEEIVW